MPAPEERIFAATLQRMYRHFYFRVCDILNATAIMNPAKWISANYAPPPLVAGIWPGVASFLKIVSDYVQRYRGTPLELPAEVIKDATVNGDKIYTRARFLRVPIMPYGARLYTNRLPRQLSAEMFRQHSV